MLIVLQSQQRTAHSNDEYTHNKWYQQQWYHLEISCALSTRLDIRYVDILWVLFPHAIRSRNIERFRFDISSNIHDNFNILGNRWIGSMEMHFTSEEDHSSAVIYE